jgi:hypothetical protein
MPTPFSHLATLIDLMDDEQVPTAYRAALIAERPAYLLGAVAPDARVDAPDPRAATHFYSYQDGIDRNPWRIMLDQYPSLIPPGSEAHRAFLAGYVAHLAMDEIWTLHMLGPHFAFGDWGESRIERFFVLHLMLVEVDQRDLATLPDWAASDIYLATPTDDWLPFMPLDVLTDWQALIYDQIKPGGLSQTTTIFGERVGRSAEDLESLASDRDWMQNHLWDHVPRSALTQVEIQMVKHARTSLIAYLDEFTHLGRD